MMVPDMNKTLTHVQMINIPNKYSEEQDSKLKMMKNILSIYTNIFEMSLTFLSKCSSTFPFYITRYLLELKSHLN